MKSTPKKPSKSTNKELSCSSIGFAKQLLVSYLTKNLSQITYTFWLSVFVMVVGFGILIWGVSKAFAFPNSLFSAAIASAAGVLTEFIGATFLLIYKSTLQQAEQYVEALERMITGEIVGKIADSIPQNLGDKVKAKVAEKMIKEIYKKQM